MAKFFSRSGYLTESVFQPIALLWLPRPKHHLERSQQIRFGWELVRYNSGGSQSNRHISNTPWDVFLCKCRLLFHQFQFDSKHLRSISPDYESSLVLKKIIIKTSPRPRLCHCCALSSPHRVSGLLLFFLCHIYGDAFLTPLG